MKMHSHPHYHNADLYDRQQMTALLALYHRLLVKSSLSGNKFNTSCTVTVLYVKVLGICVHLGFQENTLAESLLCCSWCCLSLSPPTFHEIIVCCTNIGHRVQYYTVTGRKWLSREFYNKTWGKDRTPFLFW